MSRGGWLTYFRPQAGPEIPASFRLIVAAVSGATLSLSYTGLYLSIYSWVCVGILLLSLFGVRPRVAFACGFLHGLLFVITALPWIATVLAVHGGISLAFVETETTPATNNITNPAHLNSTVPRSRSV